MAFLEAVWSDLVVLNYPIPEQAVLPYLPAGCEIDGERGEDGVLQIYASLVLFEFSDTRAFGIGWPWHRNFSEINLRLYVVFPDPATGERKRGVVFVRELVPKRAIAWIARWLYDEPYVALPIRRRVGGAAGQLPPGEGVAETPARRIEYVWGRGDANRVVVESSDIWTPLDAGSHAEFILEHYWGYTRLGNARTSEYRVAHPTWRACKAELGAIDVDFAGLYGADWGFLEGLEPASVFVAEGSPVEVLERTVHRFATRPSAAGDRR